MESLATLVQVDRLPPGSVVRVMRGALSFAAWKSLTGGDLHAYCQTDFDALSWVVTDTRGRWVITPSTDTPARALEGHSAVGLALRLKALGLTPELVPESEDVHG